MVLSRYNAHDQDEPNTSDDIEGPTVRLIKYKQETPKALLFSVDKDQPKFWLPRAEICVMPTTEPNIKMVKIQQWLATKLDLDKYEE